MYFHVFPLLGGPKIWEEALQLQALLFRKTHLGEKSTS